MTSQKNPIKMATVVTQQEMVNLGELNVSQFRKLSILDSGLSKEMKEGLNNKWNENNRRHSIAGRTKSKDINFETNPITQLNDNSP